MKKIVTLLFLVGLLSVNAQPVINYNAGHGIGTKSTTYIIGGSNTPLLQSGANVTWDLSGNTFQQAGSIDLVDPQTTPYASTYPTANLAYKQDITGQGITYNFIVDSPTDMSSLADKVGGSGTTNWEQVDKLLEYPFSYTSSFNTTRKATGNSPESYSRTYDAYGTLKANGKTYNNVVRITKNPGNSLWFTTSPAFFPIIIQVSSSTYLYNEPSTFSGIKMLNSEVMTVYPNPVAGRLVIDGLEKIHETYQVTVLDINGKTVSTVNSAEISDAGLDVSGLTPGYYIFRIRLKEKVLSGSFIRL